MLRDLVWFDGGRAANEDQPSERISGAVVYVVEDADVLEVWPRGVRPPPPPPDALALGGDGEGGGHG